MRRLPPKHRRWMLGELPRLESEGVLAPDARARLEDYYGRQCEDRTHWAPVAFAVLGALLVGGGIILLFAHNWEHFSRTTRAVLSFCPLLAGGALSVASLRRDSPALREGAGLFHAIAVGACIALIGQTYHLPGDRPAFLLTWALLVLPLVFLLPSTGALLVYLALVCSWGGVAQDTYGQALGLGLLLLPAIARTAALVRRDRHGGEALLALWALLPALVISVGLLLERTVPGIWILTFACLLGLCGLLGLTLYRDEHGWRNPLLVFGLAGSTLLLYLYTFSGVWEGIGWSHQRGGWNHKAWGVWSDVLLTLVLAVAWATASVRAVRLREPMSGFFCAFPLVAGAAFGLAALEAGPVLNAVLFNLVLFALGLAWLVEGCRQVHLRRANYGMLVLTLLIVTRFFDAGIPFLLRGIVFILLGSGFIAANLFLARRKRTLEEVAG